MQVSPARASLDNPDRSCLLRSRWFIEEEGKDIDGEEDVDEEEENMEQSSASSCDGMRRVWRSSREETEVVVVKVEKRDTGTSLRSVWLPQRKI